MMQKDDWRRLVIDAAKDVADRSFQERSWLGGGSSEISSPVEVYCVLFDDLLFDDFLREVELSEAQLSAGLALRSEMQAYTGDLSDAAIVIDDPSWQKVREVAQSFVQRMEDSHLASQGGSTDNPHKKHTS